MKTFSIAYYILNLYNRGELVCKEFDIDENTTKEEHAQELKDWLKEESEERGELFDEWIIADHDLPNDFADQWTIKAEFWEFLEALKGCSFSHLPIDVLAEVWKENENFDFSYWGEFSTLGEFAEDYINETGLMQDWPEVAKTYFNYERYARDLDLSGSLLVIDDHYFM